MLTPQSFLSFNKGIYKAVAITFFLFFLLQLLAGSFFVYQASMKNSREYVLQASKRLQQDVSFQNSSWNMYKYNADPNAVDTFPVYILALDGYVIDRWKPVAGFLDVSDFKHLLTYQSAQTVNTPTNQKWRIYSLPIIGSNNNPVAVVTVSYFNPTDDGLSAIDQKLTNEAQTIAQHITVKNDVVNSSAVDPRELNYDVAFQVVDQFNKIIAKNNNSNSIDRIPNYIDSSYVGDLLNAPGFMQIQDTKTKEKFLVYVTPLVDDKQNVIGVLVVGKSISFISDILKTYIISKIIFGFILMFIATTIAMFIMKRYLNTYLAEKKIKEDTIKKIFFNTSSSTLFLDDIEIAIPYATYQYDLCSALFSQPKKRWETKELLKEFGEKDIEHNWRKVYDAMLTVNKKVSQFANIKLILFKDKTYQMNPSLIEKMIQK